MVKIFLSITVSLFFGLIPSSATAAPEGSSNFPRTSILAPTGAAPVCVPRKNHLDSRVSSLHSGRNLQSELYVNWQKEERLLIAGGMTVIMRMLGRLDTGEQNMSHRLVQISLSLTPQGSPQPARGTAESTTNTVNTSSSYRTGNSVLGTPGCTTDSWLRNHVTVSYTHLGFSPPPKQDRGLHWKTSGETMKTKRRLGY